MADLRELATYSEDTGTYTTILALEDTDTYQAVRGSFQVKRGQRQQSMAKSQRRYAGSVITAEQIENAEITWKAVVRGASVDLALGALEDMFAAVESPRTDLFLAWKPDGATQKTLYEVRGPATWQPEHDWAQLTQNGAETVTVSIPVAPLPTTDSVTDLSAGFPTTLPAVYSPALDVPGSAPALATLQVRASGGAAAPVWALLGWAARGYVENLVTNPSNEYNAGDRTGWNATSCALSSPTGVAGCIGTYALRATASGSAAFAFYFNAGGSPRMPVTEGYEYTAAIDLLGIAGSRSHELQIRWFDSGGSALSTSRVAISGTGRKTLTATAPAGAAQASLAVEATTTGTNSDTVTIDAATFVRGTRTAYFDGTTGYWTGTAHASVSRNCLAPPPFGVLQAEDYTSVSTWAKSLSDANYSGSDGVRTTASGAGSASVEYAVDPSVMQPDDFAVGTIDIEVWARLEIAAALVTPKIVLSLEPNAGASFGASQYSAEYGATGKLLVLPSSGTRFRFVKLGTLTMPVDPVQPLKWNAKLAASWAGGSSGSFGVDYLIMVPARQRAVSRCGVANDGYFPQFIPSTSDTTKQIRPDLSGRIASGTGNKGPHTGLGGTPIELPPGPVDFVVKLSSLVADDPTVDTSSEQKTHGLTSGLIRCRPRWFYGRDA